MSTLAIEFTTSRMLQTVYGTSNIVWANVIGLVLFFLTLGYFLGGRIADRNPTPKLFYQLVTATGLTDTAGNAIGTPNSATFSGSATAPTAASLAAASDTGTLGDNITGAAFPSPGLQFTGTTTANTTVYLYDDGVLVATAVSNASGAYTVTLTSGATVAASPATNIFTIATVGPTGLVSDSERRCRGARDIIRCAHTCV